VKKLQDLEENIFGFVDISHRRYKLRRDVEQTPSSTAQVPSDLAYFEGLQQIRCEARKIWNKYVFLGKGLKEVLFYFWTLYYFYFNKIPNLKGTVAPDFWPTVFLIRSTHLGPPTPYNLFVFCFNFVELFKFEV
jgi:hypothetical protein